MDAASERSPINRVQYFITLLVLSECIYRQLDAIIISSLKKLTLTLSSAFALQRCDIYTYTV